MGRLSCLTSCCMYACMHVCMYVCMYVCMHVCVCISIQSGGSGTNIWAACHVWPAVACTCVCMYVHEYVRMYVLAPCVPKKAWSLYTYYIYIYTLRPSACVPNLSNSTPVSVIKAKSQRVVFTQKKPCTILPCMCAIVFICMYACMHA